MKDKTIILIWCVSYGGGYVFPRFLSLGVPLANSCGKNN